jgi:hypothetical protein
MKTSKYSATAAFFGRGKTAPAPRKAASDTGKLAQLRVQTGVSLRALTLFSRLSDHEGFTVDAARKDFGHVKSKQVA